MEDDSFFNLTNSVLATIFSLHSNADSQISKQSVDFAISLLDQNIHVLPYGQLSALRNYIFDYWTFDVIYLIDFFDDNWSLFLFNCLVQQFLISLLEKKNSIFWNQILDKSFLWLGEKISFFRFQMSQFGQFRTVILHFEDGFGFIDEQN